MATGSSLSPEVLAAKEELAQGRQKLGRQHAAGSPGVQVCTLMTELLDEVILALHASVWQNLSAAEQAPLAGQYALVAHSGFGRREMAPYSDIDLMLLHDAREADAIVFNRRLSQTLYDLGVDLGFSVRKLSDIPGAIHEDPTIFTSLAESRFLAGSEELYHRYTKQLARATRQSARALVLRVEQERKAERTKYGETVYLLEPNVKRSRGGLRDLQLIRWIAYAAYQQRDFDELYESGHLLRMDLSTLRDAREFLLRVRNELHFHVGQSHDVLDRSEQVRLAELWQLPPIEGLHPAEQFMRIYFQHTGDVRDIGRNFVENARPRNPLRWFWEPLWSHRMEGDYLVGPSEITTTRRGLGKLTGDVAEILRLMELSSLHNKRIDPRTWETIRRTMSERTPALDQDLPPEVIHRFLDLLAEPSRLAESLRRLHELRVLEQIVPAVKHTRGLLQFNEYHKYTVDEHTLKAVEELTGLLKANVPAGEVYRRLRHKRTVHLAILLHDLGKGYVEDHSEVGFRIAQETGRRLHLPEHERETLEFLVHKHLLMSHVAQRMDINDPDVVLKFAVDVGSLEHLQMLYVLTCADMAAVGPGVLNDWKQRLLADLYRATERVLTGDAGEYGRTEQGQKRRQEVRAAAKDGYAAWWDSQIAQLPRAYLFGAPPEEIVAELEKLRVLPHRDAVAWGRFLDDRQVIEYTVGTYEEITPGIFHKLTGALTSKRQSILTAEIHTLGEGLVLDRFYVEDADFAGAPPEGRLEEISQALVAALKDNADKPPVFRKLWQEQARAKSPVLDRQPTHVVYDNSSSEGQTILSIFAYDRMGLLYAITRTLFEVGLSVTVAKISTRLDQVADVFYVVDSRTGQKVLDEGRLGECCERLLREIELLAKAE